MRPDSLAFSYRASAFKVYRKEKKKSDEFYLRNPGVEHEFQYHGGRAWSFKEPHQVEDTQPALIIRESVFEPFNAAVNNKPDGPAHENSAK